MSGTTQAEWERAEGVLDVALDMPADQRSAFLEAACAGDPELLSRARSLLAYADRAGDFLERSAATCAGGLLREIALEYEPGRFAASTASPSETRFGPYHLIRELGRGGMGAVYLAARDDEQYDRRVAIKIIRAGVPDPALPLRFILERRILARLEHPNVARLYDAGVENGTPYFVMEYVEGRRIDVHCHENRLSIRERLTLFEQVCDAVAFAHRNLIVHRDLKPANILVSNDGVVKLLDFGIAKLMNDESGAGSTVSGYGGGRALTPEYASPEQLRGEPVSTSTDVYSLGVLLFELLTGQWPYRRRDHSALSIERAILEQEPNKPSVVVDQVNGAAGRERNARGASAIERRSSTISFKRQLRGDLDAIVLKALRKEPEQRFVSVQALSEDIRRHLTGHPVLARRQTLGYRARRFVRRYRAVAAAGGLALSTLMAGFAATAWQARKAAIQRDVALQESDKTARVSSLMSDFFFLADPGQARGENITMRAALDTLRLWVERDLATQPELRAEMAYQLGEIYYRLGHYQNARELWEAALTTTTASHGVADERVFRVMLLLAKGLEDLGRSDSAEVIARRALAIQRQIPELEDDRFITTHVLARLGNALRLQGRLAEAEAVIREALAILPPQHRDAPHRRSVLLTTLAHIRRSADKPAEAEALLREVLDTRRAVWGDEHPEVAQVLVNLAGAIADQGRFDEAEMLALEGLNMRRRLLGERHPDVAAALAVLADVRRLENERFRDANAVDR